MIKKIKSINSNLFLLLLLFNSPSCSQTAIRIPDEQVISPHQEDRTSNLTQSINPGIEKLLPGIVSTDAVETSVGFTNDGNTCFFVRHTGNWGSPTNPPANIYMCQKTSSGWSTAILASFSDSLYNDSDFYIAPDNSILFASNRPHAAKKGEGNDIWKVDYSDGSWSVAKPLNNFINTENTEGSPVLDKVGNLYFMSIRENGEGMGDIYFAPKLPTGSFETPQLVRAVSTQYGEWNVFVSPEANWMIFESSGRPNAMSPYGDLYYSKKKNGEWQPAQPLTILNTTGSDLNVRLSPDGRFLYYASSERLDSRNVDLFKINLEEVLNNME